MKRTLLAASPGKSFLERIRISFQSAGFDVYTSQSGNEVLDMAAEIEPDVILLSTALPGKDGYELGPQLRNQSRLRDIPLFLVSGFLEQVKKDRLSGVVFEDLIRMPLDSNSLVSRVNQCLEHDTAPLSLPEEPESPDSAELDSRIERAWEKKEKTVREMVTEQVKQEMLAAERELEKRLNARLRVSGGAESNEHNHE